MSKKKGLAFGYKVSAHLAYWHAQDFKKSAEIIYDSEVLKTVVVNLAFSCELYMKSLLMLQRKSQEIVVGHELDKLFAALDEPVRKRVAEETTIKDWNGFMKDSSNVFEAWRYYYEKDKSMIGHIPELFRLADVLDGICSEIFASKEVL